LSYGRWSDLTLVRCCKYHLDSQAPNFNPHRGCESIFFDSGPRPKIFQSIPSSRIGYDLTMLIKPEEQSIFHVRARRRSLFPSNRAAVSESGKNLANGLPEWTFGP
jgi:hypothetical protein